MVEEQGCLLRESSQENFIEVFLSSWPLKLMQKLTIYPLRMYGRELGLGMILSTTSLSNSTLTLLITGERESVRSWMIFSEGFQSSVMKTWCPFPFSAHSSTSCSEQPFPIPMVCTREYLLLASTMSVITLVLDTAPSVSRKMCFGQPSIGFLVNILANGLQISVPPISASISFTAFTAELIDLSLYLELSANNSLLFVPKLTTLKQISSGRLLMKSTNASLAFSIRLPPIDPLRSSRKMYSPLACSISVSKGVPLNEA